MIDANGQRIPDEGQVLESHLDAVMEELVHLDAGDPAIDTDLSNNSVVLSLMVEAPNPLTAVDVASGYLRSAIHAAGGSTPDWPGRHDKAWEVMLVSLRCDLVSA